MSDEAKSNADFWLKTEADTRKSADTKATA